jgi:hypothetical protein
MVPETKFPSRVPIALPNNSALHARNRALLEKSIASQLTNKFLSVFGTRGFITVVIRTSHWTLS